MRGVYLAPTIVSHVLLSGHPKFKSVGQLKDPVVEPHHLFEAYQSVGQLEFPKAASLKPH